MLMTGFAVNEGLPPIEVGKSLTLIQKHPKPQ
jgi:hypothetical protein